MPAAPMLAAVAVILRGRREGWGGGGVKTNLLKETNKRAGNYDIMEVAELHDSKSCS